MAPTTWKDLDTLYVNSFMDKMQQRPDWANWPRFGNGVMPDATFVPYLNTGTTDKCSSDDVSVALNTFQSLQYMNQIGVDPAVIQRLEDWGAALWPLGNWNYWK